MPGQVEIWYTLTADVPEACLAGLRGLLSEEERERCDRFRFAGDRRERLIARAHVRTVLSRYAAMAPAEWRFDSGAAGKPRIVNPAPGQPLHFNLSHTRGLVASIVSRIPESGIDVENTAREADYSGVAERVFSASELRALSRLAGSEYRCRFFQLWTLKEAYSKALGVGLGFEFRKLSFDLGEGRIAAKFEPDLHDAAAAWHFETMRPTSEHQMAIAVRMPAGQRITAGIHRWQPG